MPLNKACAGKQYPAQTMEATLEATQKYARACNDDNPAYFDAKRPSGVIAPPMFGVVVTWPTLMSVIGDNDLKVDVVRLLHGEQDMEFFRPIRPGDKITSTARIAAIEDKGSGETLVVELNAKNQSDEQVQRILFNAFIRGAGRGGAGERPPEPQRGEPTASVTQQIDKDQTYRYKEASGDPNPIHVDEGFAKMAGLPGIIVHGLCTMAFVLHALIEKLAGGDPLKLKRLRVRFTRPVFPGQAITTKMWAEGARDGRKVYAFETFNPDGQAVIRAGIAEIA